MNKEMDIVIKHVAQDLTDKIVYILDYYSDLIGEDEDVEDNKEFVQKRIIEIDDEVYSTLVKLVQQFTKNDSSS